MSVKINEMQMRALKEQYSDFPQLINFCFDFVLIWIDLKEFQVDSSGNLKHLPIIKSLPIKWIGNLKEFHLETHLPI